MVALAGRRSARLPVRRTEKDQKRADQRRTLGSLAGQLIQSQTLIRYEEAFQEVCNFTQVTRYTPVTDWESFDYQLGAFLEQLWETGRAKSHASYALSAAGKKSNPLQLETAQGLEQG